MVHKVLMVGSAEASGGGVAAVIALIKKMPVWEKYSCDWLGTQIQKNYLCKLWYAVSSWIKACFIIHKYDIVHFHTVPDRICLVIQFPVFLLALLTKKNIVMHIHIGNQLEHTTRSSLFLWHLNRADQIIVLSDKWKRLFEEKYPSVKTPVSVIYNACEIPEKCAYPVDSKSIIFVGYLSDRKAPNLLLEAWSKIRHSYPDWHLTFMGNGEIARFRKLAKEMDLQDCVSFEGYVRGQRKKEYFRGASMLVLCSYNEAFPMSILEAWSYGIPVISTPAGGLPDVIVEDKNCCTFNFGDSDELATKLERLINSPSLRQEMSEYSRNFAITHFSLNSINEDYISLYESLLEQ